MAPIESTLQSRTRRSFLATVGAGAVSITAGCAGLASNDGGEGDTVEIIPTNDTDESVTVAVRVEDGEGTPIFSRVYDLAPGHSDESAGVDTEPATVHAFTDGGVAETWEYAPELSCEGPDVGFWVRADGIEPWYAC
ncbi:hypothetical protein [Haloarcula litorea]|uniref:hypothetical protein n=1 Tax=Haloarcula litorea TaxID=3032579 RepID=UPI0023E7BCB4|nr:hypothetical protein [Halomicroarcula sp. GDY20]